MCMKKKVGINGLRKHYGGSKRRGTKTNVHALAAGKNIRYCLAQLKEAGLVSDVFLQDETSGSSITAGKVLTKKAITDMDRIASQMHKERRRK